MEREVGVGEKLKCEVGEKLKCEVEVEERNLNSILNHNLQPQPISLIRCLIETGRTHQIRVHMASLGCPVIGDAVYGKSALDKKLDPVPQRQMLHAWRLKLWHPVKSVQMFFEAPLPADMQPYCLA